MQHAAVSREEWLAARVRLLVKEKELTRQRDALAAERRALPWVRVEKDYRFEMATGTATLAELFAGRRQLIVYHFMFGPDWEEGCKSCSILADHIDASAVHLAQRDVTLVVVSRAPFARLEGFKRRMGWRFPWVSSLGSEFNFDHQVSFPEHQAASAGVYYNYRRGTDPAGEAPGLSVFWREPSGEVFHTYSCYARGLDPLMGIYNWLDLVPKGRDEADLPWPMAWVRHHDSYPVG